MRNKEEILLDIDSLIALHTQNILSLKAVFEGKEYQWREQGIVRGLTLARKLIEDES